MNSYLNSLTLVVGTFVILTSCTHELKRIDGSDDKTNIVADVSFNDESARSKAVEGTRGFFISPVDEETDAILIAKVCPNESYMTKGSIQKEMYSEFSAGLDEIDENGRNLKVGIENEKMSKNNAVYSSSNLFPKYYRRCTSSKAIMLWGYAPYDERNMTCLEDGARLIDMKIDDPIRQNDIVAFACVDNSPSLCLSPLSYEVIFSHVLTSVRFFFTGSPGITGTIDKLRISGIRSSGKYGFYDSCWNAGDEKKDWNFVVDKEFGPEDEDVELLGDDNHLFFIPQSFDENAAIEIDYDLNIVQSGKSRRGTLKAPLSFLGNWEQGVSVEYLISFKDRLQPEIESFLPDTLFWERKEGDESGKSVHIQGKNLDVIESSCEISGDDADHWAILSADYSDDGKTASIAIAPKSANSSDNKEAKFNFVYPEVPAAGNAEVVLVHKGSDAGKQLFAAVKKSDFKESSSLENSYVAVRPKRDGNVYLYLNDDGEWASDNVLGVPGGTGNNDWIADFSDLESSCGISFKYDGTTHLLTMSVSDLKKFESRLGSIVELHCSLVSGSKKLTILLKLMPDFHIGGLDEFYVGMKRLPVPSGFCGSVKMKAVNETDLIRYGNDRDKLGVSPVPVQNIFAYSGGNVQMVFFSDDDFNDSAISENVNVFDPKLSMKISDNRLFVHGDEAEVSLEYQDNSGNTIPEKSFDADSYKQLLDVIVKFCKVDGKPYIGSECYAVKPESGSYEVFVRDVPDNYEAQVQYYSLLVANAGYDSSNKAEIETIIPAFDSNGISELTASIDDYLSLNVDVPKQVTSKHSFSYGVKSAGDLSFSVIPVSADSFENDCISACIDDKDNGHISFTLEDEDIEDMTITHSVGRHKVVVSTFNKHSGKKIMRNDIAPSLNVYVHAAVGAAVFLTDYSEGHGFTANIFGDKFDDVYKCSLTDIAGENFTRVISSEFSGISTVYKWHSLAIKAEIQAYQSVFGEENAFLTIMFSVNPSGSSEYEIENARNIINNVWNDSTGSSFYGNGGLYGLVPGMRLYNGATIRTDNIGTSELTDENGKGFYYVHILEDLDRNSRGWLNIYHDTGMPHDGYSL